MMMRGLRERTDDANLLLLRRWVQGEDDALDDWLSGRVRPIRRHRRRIALP